MSKNAAFAMKNDEIRTLGGSASAVGVEAAGDGDDSDDDGL